MKNPLMLIALSIILMSVFAASAAPAAPAGPPHDFDIISQGHEGSPVGGPGSMAPGGFDPNSFGRAVTYLGGARTNPITFLSGSDCDQPGAPDPCIPLEPVPQQTNFDVPDTEVIELPRGATHSLICFTVTTFPFMSWSNPDPVQHQAYSFMSAVVSIENDTLIGVTDVVTGEELNGVVEIPLTLLFDEWTMQPFESRRSGNRLSRGCTGGFVNEVFLANQLGMSEAEIREFFREPMTVRFGSRGTVKLLSSGTWFYGIRLYGD